MSIRLMSLVWADHTGILTAAEKSILLRLADFAADNGTQIFPSLDRIGDDTGYKSRRQVINILKSLIIKKYIRKINRKDGAQFLTNNYRINVDLLIDNQSEKGIIGRAKITPPHSDEVGQRLHQGRVKIAPDPSIDPPIHIYKKQQQQNNTPREEKPKTENVVVVSEKVDEEEAMKVSEKLISMGLSKLYAEKYLKSYGIPYIKDVIQYVEENGDPNRNPAGLLATLLRDKADVYLKKKTPPNAIKPGLTEEQIFERKIAYWTKLKPHDKIKLFNEIKTGSTPAMVFGHWADDNLTHDDILLDSYPETSAFSWMAKIMNINDLDDEWHEEKIA